VQEKRIEEWHADLNVSEAFLVYDEKSLSDYGVGQAATLRLKDLGAQTSYRNLYLWEYVSLGPPKLFSSSTRAMGLPLASSLSGKVIR
jgi:hypothetical protein